MGADIRVHARTAEAAPAPSRCADIEVRKSRLQRHPRTRVAGAAGDRRVSGVLHRGGLLPKGETLVRGALELRVKESDRLAAMAQG